MSKKKTAPKTLEARTAQAEADLAAQLAAEAKKEHLVNIPLAQIGEDEFLQARAGGLLPERVEKIMTAYEEGADVDPVKAFWDERAATYWVYDGQHRREAIKKLGPLFASTIRALVRPGTLEEAREEASAANHDHLGQPRTHADEDRAIRNLLLGVPKWRAKSDREIAKRCALPEEGGRKRVKRVWDKLVSEGLLAPREGERVVSRGGVEFTQKAKEKAPASGPMAQIEERQASLPEPTPTPRVHQVLQDLERKHADRICEVLITEDRSKHPRSLSLALGILRDQACEVRGPLPGTGTVYYVLFGSPHGGQICTITFGAQKETQTEEETHQVAGEYKVYQPPAPPSSETPKQKEDACIKCGKPASPGYHACLSCRNEEMEIGAVAERSRLLRENPAMALRYEQEGRWPFGPSRWKEQEEAKEKDEETREVINTWVKDVLDAKQEEGAGESSPARKGKLVKANCLYCLGVGKIANPLGPNGNPWGTCILCKGAGFIKVELLPGEGNGGAGYQNYNSPPILIEFAREIAPIGLDPCHNSGSMWDARVVIDEKMDSLSPIWAWSEILREDELAAINPPWSNMPPFVDKLAIEAAHGKQWLLIGRGGSTTAVWYQKAMRSAALRIEPDKRIGYYKDGKEDTSPQDPTVMFYWGRQVERVTALAERRGWLVTVVKRATEEAKRELREEEVEKKQAVFPVLGKPPTSAAVEGSRLTCPICRNFTTNNAEMLQHHITRDHAAPIAEASEEEPADPRLVEALAALAGTLTVQECNGVRGGLLAKLPEFEEEITAAAKARHARLSQAGKEKAEGAGDPWVTRAKAKLRACLFREDLDECFEALCKDADDQEKKELSDLYWELRAKLPSRDNVKPTPPKKGFKQCERCHENYPDILQHTCKDLIQAPKKEKRVSSLPPGAKQCAHKSGSRQCANAAHMPSKFCGIHQKNVKGKKGQVGK